MHVLMEVHEFQKGVKCNITIYSSFKDDWQYDSWYHETYAIACIHGTEHIFNSTYIPTQTSSVLLWIEIKYFCFLSFVITYKHQSVGCY